MRFFISANTDIGTGNPVNQDSLFVRTLKTRQGPMVLAVLCDGMGGLSQGEVASATVISAFTAWMRCELPVLSQDRIEDSVIRAQWDGIISDQNEILLRYGKQNGTSLGATVVAMLLTGQSYYILNVGDSRAYEMIDSPRMITKDQTVVAREVELGRLTPRQASRDPRRHVLWQCVGASGGVIPEFFFGKVIKNAIYMLCSDGFRNTITHQEIYDAFQPGQMINGEIMNRRAQQLIATCKRRGERDNISVVTVRTF